MPNASRYLKPGVTFETLDAIATQYSDNAAAQRLNQARAERFQRINRSHTNAA